MSVFSDAAVLVVDDSGAFRQIMAHRLSLLGCRDITMASDGDEALGFIRERAFDLILLDIEMPGLNGFQVLEQMRGSGLLHRLPVIMISGTIDTSGVVRCIELGAEDFLPKSFDPTLLRARAGAVLEKKRLRDQNDLHLRRLERELEVTRQLQLGMVPSSFPRATRARPVELTAVLEPALEVGGDLYDFFYLAPGLLGFAIGDVSGKGVPAALFMARARSVTRSVARVLFRDSRQVPDPSRIMAVLDEELSEDNPEMMFVTLLVGFLEVGSGLVRFCNAGHNRPFLLRRGAPTEPIGSYDANPVLGVGTWREQACQELRLSAGEGLFLYTDGISEALNLAGDFYTEERLQADLDELADRQIVDLPNEILARVRAFAGAAPQADDITALAFRWRAEAQGREQAAN